MALNILRGIAIVLTQLLLIIFAGAKFDLFFGFNRMDSGFTLLAFLFALVPLLNLIWFITEVVFSVKHFNRRHWSQAFPVPVIAFFFFIESLAVDLYIVSHARM